ncbi:MAG TPA: hypothetical protein GXX49_08650 [Clostridiaceae bacterium]|nr:hypothetical protein [Clostridiaceae bacterium]
MTTIINSILLHADVFLQSLIVNLWIKTNRIDLKPNKNYITEGIFLGFLYSSTGEVKKIRGRKHQLALENGLSSLSQLYKLILVTVVSLLMLFSSGCSLFPEEEEVLAPPMKKPPEVEYQYIDVARGDVIQEITGYGYFYYIVKRDVAFEYRMGPLKGIYAKKGDLVKKGDLLAELDMADIEEKIEKQKLTLRKLEIDYTAAVTKNLDALELEKILLDIEAAKITLADLERDYNRGRLVAPIDGQVDYISTRFKERENVETGWTIVRIADTSRTLLVYNGQSASLFRPGDIIEVKIENKPYTGEVIPPPEDLSEDLASKNQSNVYITLKDYDGVVPAGTTGTIRYEVARRENVIRIPKRYLRIYSTRKYVLVLEDGLKKERDVVTGIESAEFVEIISGLNEGDKLYID